MLAVSSPSTKDLRSRAIDQKRYTESQHKWNPKWVSISNSQPVVNFGPNNTQRPIRKSKTHRLSTYEHTARGKALERAHEGKKQVSEDRNLQRRTLKRTHKERGEESLEQSVELPGNAFGILSRELGDENLLRGQDYPVTGNTVLEVALDKAVERYEDKTLMKLVKDEYEVLDLEDEHTSPLHRAEASDLDDDFELV